MFPTSGQGPEFARSHPHSSLPSMCSYIRTVKITWLKGKTKKHSLTYYRILEAEKTPYFQSSIPSNSWTLLVRYSFLYWVLNCVPSGGTQVLLPMMYLCKLKPLPPLCNTYTHLQPFVHVKGRQTTSPVLPYPLKWEVWFGEAAWWWINLHLGSISVPIPTSWWPWANY